MKSEDLIAKLQSEVKRLRKLKGEEVSGFFFIMPPEQEVLCQTFVGAETNRQAFYQYLGVKVTESQKAAAEAAGGAYIGVAGMGRRG